MSSHRFTASQMQVPMHTTSRHTIRAMTIHTQPWTMYRVSAPLPWQLKAAEGNLRDSDMPLEKQIIRELVAFTSFISCLSFQLLSSAGHLLNILFHMCAQALALQVSWFERCLMIRAMASQPLCTLSLQQAIYQRLNSWLNSGTSPGLWLGKYGLLKLKRGVIERGTSSQAAYAALRHNFLCASMWFHLCV